MISEFTFLRIYKSLANGKAETKELLKLYDDLQAILGEDTPFAKWFKDESPDRLGAAIAIDAVAHAIHQEGEDTLHQIFPDAEYSVIKSELDKLAGLEKNSQIRQYNRGYFTTLLAEDSVFLLEKQLTQAGRTTREAILPAIKEYEKLYKAGLSSPAEILTLSRYYPDNEQYRLAIIKLGLDNEDNHPVVVGGPASVEMIDREGHLITTEALDHAFTKFMANFRERNVNILHSDVSVGWVLPAYMTRDGRVFSSGVDDKQLWVLSEIRGDTRIAKRVAQEVLDKNLRSYSIAGSALDVQDMQKGANSYKEVREMEMSEITLCERGMNSQANFDLIKSIDPTPSFDSILTSFKDELSPFSGTQIYVENSGEVPSVIIKADKYNSIIDMLVLELQKMLPENTPVIVKYDVSDAIPVYKMQLVPIWTTPQTQREADHSFPAKLEEDTIVKEAEGMLQKLQPPRPGLVPQSGDWERPDRWIRPSKEERHGGLSDRRLKLDKGDEVRIKPKAITEYGLKPSQGIGVVRRKQWDFDSKQWLIDIEFPDGEKMLMVPTDISYTGRTERLKKANIFYEEESEEINKRKKTEKGKNPHKFIAAEWTHKNGHPRCKICGMEEGMTKMCPGLDKADLTKGETQNMGKAIDLFKFWLKKEKELDSPGRKVLHDFEGRQSKLRQLLDEQGMPEDIEPKDLDKLRDEEVMEDNAQPWVVSEAGQHKELSPEQKAEVRGKHKIERFDN